MNIHDWFQLEKNSVHSKAILWGTFWEVCGDLPPNFSEVALIWRAANGGLRDGGLRKSEDMWGKTFFLRFMDFPGREAS